MNNNPLGTAQNPVKDILDLNIALATAPHCICFCAKGKKRQAILDFANIDSVKDYMRKNNIWLKDVSAVARSESLLSRLLKKIFK